MNPSTLLEGIGGRVRARRTNMGWTLREVAERSGVSLRFLTDLEAGRGNISVRRLNDVARALDVPIASLFPTDETSGLVVALVGLRGAGKSTIGRALARRLKLPFIELDRQIERETELSLAELFSLHGEAYYKRMAYTALVKLLARGESMILATGGSIVTDAETWQLLRRRTYTVWLKATPEDHWKRVLRQGDTRPMANNASAMGELRAILAQRASVYAEAAQTIDTSTTSVSDAVRVITAALPENGAVTPSKNGTRERRRK